MVTYELFFGRDLDQVPGTSRESDRGKDWFPTASVLVYRVWTWRPAVALETPRRKH